MRLLTRVHSALAALVGRPRRPTTLVFDAGPAPTGITVRRGRPC